MSRENCESFPYTIHQFHSLGQTKRLIDERDDNKGEERDAARIEQNEENAENDAFRWNVLVNHTQFIREAKEHHQGSEQTHDEGNGRTGGTKSPHPDLVITNR